MGLIIEEPENEELLQEKHDIKIIRELIEFYSTEREKGLQENLERKTQYEKQLEELQAKVAYCIKTIQRVEKARKTRIRNLDKKIQELRSINENDMTDKQKAELKKATTEYERKTDPQRFTARKRKSRKTMAEILEETKKRIHEIEEEIQNCNETLEMYNSNTSLEDERIKALNNAINAMEKNPNRQSTKFEAHGQEGTEAEENAGDNTHENSGEMAAPYIEPEEINMVKIIDFANQIREVIVCGRRSKKDIVDYLVRGYRGALNDIDVFNLGGINESLFNFSEQRKTDILKTVFELNVISNRWVYNTPILGRMVYWMQKRKQERIMAEVFSDENVEETGVESEKTRPSIFKRIREKIAKFSRSEKMREIQEVKKRSTEEDIRKQFINSLMVDVKLENFKLSENPIGQQIGKQSKGENNWGPKIVGSR